MSRITKHIRDMAEMVETTPVVNLKTEPQHLSGMAVPSGSKEVVLIGAETATHIAQLLHEYANIMDDMG